MPIYTRPYSIRDFNELHSRSEAIQAVQDKDPHIHIRLKGLLHQYGLQTLFGIALVYKHYPLEGKKALFWQQFPTPFDIEEQEIRDIDLYGQALKEGTHIVRPAAWAIVSANKLMPYQFIQVRGQTGYAVDPRRVELMEFMHEFVRIVDWADLSPYIGLKLLTITDSHDLVSRHAYSNFTGSPLGIRRLPRERTPSPSRSRTRRDSDGVRVGTPSGDTGRDIGPLREESPVTEMHQPDNSVRGGSSDSRPDTTDETAALSRLSTEPEERLGTPTEDAADDRRRPGADTRERFPSFSDEQKRQLRERGTLDPE